MIKKLRFISAGLMALMFATLVLLAQTKSSHSAVVFKKYSNPMEWVGEAHNAGVRYIGAKIKITPKTLPDQVEIEKFANEYFGAVGIISQKNASFQKSPDTKVIIDSLVKKGIVTLAGAKEISTLLTGIEEAQSLKMILNKIEQHEQSAIGSLRDRELLFFQGMAAVARHSLKLWAPISEGGEDFGQSIIGASTAKKTNWRKVIHVALADVRGYLVGGPTGAVIWSVLAYIFYD